MSPVNEAQRDPKSAGTKHRTQQAGYADGINRTQHDVEDADNEEGAAVLR